MSAQLRYVDTPSSSGSARLDPEPAVRAAAFADACRLNALYMIARAGSGHIGTSFSCIDILSWLHLEVLGEGDRYFSSKGHDAPALYAVLIGLGRLAFDLLHRLRRLGGLPGHPDVRTTPQIVTNTGSLGMGISKAKGFALADRLAGREGGIFVLTGDGELQEGQFWESLGRPRTWASARSRPSSTTTSSSRTPGSRRSPTSATSRPSSRRSAGRSRAATATTSARSRPRSTAARGRPRPKLIIADTRKGGGVSFMEPTAARRGDRALRLSLRRAEPRGVRARRSTSCSNGWPRSAPPAFD